MNIGCAITKKHWIVRFVGLAIFLHFFTVFEVNAVDQKISPTVYLDGDVARYEGRITSSGNLRLASLLSEYDGIQWLEIESVGGEVDQGMDLGEIVFANNLNVRVIGRGCASSCANYVFVAGKKKEIASGALLVWHGSAHQENFGLEIERVVLSLPEEERPKARAELAQVFSKKRAREVAFYRQAGVDMRVAIFGHQVSCRCAWTLSVADMESFGIRDVVTAADYPALPESQVRKGLRLLNLSDYPNYEIRK